MSDTSTNIGDAIEFLTSLLQSFVASFAGGVVLNLIVSGGVFWLVWKVFAERLRRWKINKSQSLREGQVYREVKNALVVLATGALFSTLVIYLGEQDKTKIYLAADSYPIWWIFLSFPFLLIVNDTVFYWVHRFLHTERCYKPIHHEHHKSVTVNPVTGLSFHWLEPIMLTVWILPVALLVPIYAPILGLVQIYGLFDNLKSHLGYEIYPKWFVKSPLRFLTTSTYHDLHHTKFRGNYGLHFRFWDWLCQTEITDYEERFDALVRARAEPDQIDARR